MVRRARQLGFEFRRQGGARARAGRPPNGRTAGVSHLRRPLHAAAHPLHVTLSVKRGVASLREGSLFAVVRQALAHGKQHFGFSLVHFSVQRDHLHLIAEADDRRALSRGIQGLSIRIARAVNGHLGRTGRLFADRYHARALKTPRAAYFALRYVLSNGSYCSTSLRSRNHEGQLIGSGCGSFPGARTGLLRDALEHVGPQQVSFLDDPRTARYGP